MTFVGISFSSTMKHFFTLLFIQLLCFKAFGVTKDWTGATSSDWNIDTNWSPVGVPTESDDVVIRNEVNAPRIFAGTMAKINDIDMRMGSSLIIDQNATLHIARNIANSKQFSPISAATLTNYGTFIMEKPQLPSDLRPHGISLVSTTNIHNHGSMSITSVGDALVYFMPSTATVTNYGNGGITLNGDNDLQFYDPGVFINHGLFYALGQRGLFINSSTFTNSGLTYAPKGLSNYGTITNINCGRMILGVLTTNSKSFVNSAFVYVLGQHTSTPTGFTNNGVVKYGILAGSFTNNHISITDNANPIFRLGNQVDETINGIFLDMEGTQPAGSYDQTSNVFTPNTDLPPGPLTLYVMITPASGSCSSTMPFEYTVPTMPVTLVSFTGKKLNNNQVQLKWITSGEVNFDRFAVQRAPDGKTFETIGSTPGSEVLAALKTYEFVDNHPNGDSYYRLKMIDTDDTFSHSKIIHISSGPFEQHVVGPLYPNPSSGEAFVDLFAVEKGEWVISILDQSGKVIRSERKQVQSGMNKLKIENLSKGLNLVQFENGKEAMIRKLISE